MTQFELEEWHLNLTGEALLYGVLGKILYEDPNLEWLQDLIRDEVFAEIPFGAEQPEAQQGAERLWKWSQQNAAGISPEVFAALKLDFMKHFVGLGPMTVTPWESVYLSEKRLLFQEQTTQVREWYARFGLQLTRLHKEPDDQIGLEMSFVAHLATLGAQAIETGDLAAFESALQAQREFLSTHLLRWGPTWAKQLLEEAETDFFRGLASLSLGAMLASAAMLHIEPPREAAA